MSIYPEDWESFELMSGKVAVRDISQKDRKRDVLIGGVKGGVWKAFAIYSEDMQSIESVIAGTEELIWDMYRNKDIRKAEKDKRKVKTKEEDLELGNGLVTLFDEALERVPRTERIRLNDELVGAWGDPMDEKKSDGQRMFELACHATGATTFYPRINSAGFGLFAKLASKRAKVLMIMDDKTYDVIGIEIKAV